MRVWRLLFWASLALATWFFLAPVKGLPPLFPGADKLVHAGTHAWLALLRLASMRLSPGIGESDSTRRRALVWAGLFAYGAAIEVLQNFTGRTFSVADMAANGAGGALGVLAYSLVRRLVPAKVDNRPDLS